MSLTIIDIIHMTVGYTRFGWSLKDWQGKEGAYQKIQGLLTNGHPEIEDKTRTRKSPLQEAAYFDMPEIVRLLLEYGASVDYRIKKDPINYHSSKHPGLDPDGREWDLDKKGPTALYYASQRGNLECVKILCSYGANVNLANYIGHTPVHSALNLGQMETVSFLISQGADLSLRLCDGWSPIKSLLDYCLRKSTFLYSDWKNRHKICAPILQAMINSGISVEIENSLIDRLVGYLPLDTFPTITGLSSSSSLTLDMIKKESSFLTLLWLARQNWSLDNHHTFTPGQKRDISSYRLLTGLHGIGKTSCGTHLPSESWGLIYSFVVPRLPNGSYLRFTA